jgi:transcriptional regulator with XRE-family HTH domain
MLRMAAGDKAISWEKRAFARVLFELRQERNLTQEELAFESGYHPKYIGLLEREKYSPSLTTILELADALHISGADFIGRVEKMMPRNRYRRRDTRTLR